PADQDVVAAIAYQPVAAVAANQQIATATAGQHIVAVAAEQNVEPRATLELVVTGIAIEPGGIADATGHLDVVIAGLPEGNDPAGGVVDALGHAIDCDLDVASVPDRVKGDGVIAGGAAGNQSGLARVAGVVLEGDGHDGDSCGLRLDAAVIVL